MYSYHHNVRSPVYKSIQKFVRSCCYGTFFLMWYSISTIVIAIAVFNLAGATGVQITNKVASLLCIFINGSLILNSQTTKRRFYCTN